MEADQGTCETMQKGFVINVEMPVFFNNIELKCFDKFGSLDLEHISERPGDYTLGVDNVDYKEDAPHLNHGGKIDCMWGTRSHHQFWILFDDVFTGHDSQAF